ncbi:MAG: hypothetical protein LBK99_18690 [Opitutaceae bacterium]|jgi:hypothetical protein|nr:hypothetical protein [Opitutaceae bacterium]
MKISFAIAAAVLFSNVGLYARTLPPLTEILKPAPLLAYSFSDDSGPRVRDNGRCALHLEISPAWSWGVPGSGVAGGPTLMRTGDRDIFVENREAANSGLDGLRSFTVCGWYKLGFNERHTGVLFELEASGGNGFQLHFSSRAEAGGDGKRQGPWRHALVAVIGPKGTNPHTGEGVRYSSWENPCARPGEWIFFAVVVDTIQADNGFLRFYAASENEPLALIGQSRQPENRTRDFALGKIGAIRLGNSADLKMPVPVGTCFDEFRFHGSASDNTGALSREMLKHIYARCSQVRGKAESGRN